MSNSAQDMLCKALDLAEQAVHFYDNTLASCSQSMGREVFVKMKEDKLGQIERIKAIHAGLASGAQWAEVCTLGAEEAADARGVLKAFVAKYPDATCPASEKAALSVAIEIEDKIQSFYQDKAKEATDVVEKEFMRQMVQETRSHYLLLRDMEYYFEDPAGWHLGNERSGLDGA